MQVRARTSGITRIPHRPHDGARRVPPVGESGVGVEVCPVVVVAVVTVQVEREPPDAAGLERDPAADGQDDRGATWRHDVHALMAAPPRPWGHPRVDERSGAIHRASPAPASAPARFSPAAGGGCRVRRYRTGGSGLAGSRLTFLLRPPGCLRCQTPGLERLESGELRLHHRPAIGQLLLTEPLVRQRRLEVAAGRLEPLHLPPIVVDGIKVVAGHHGGEHPCPLGGGHVAGRECSIAVRLDIAPDGELPHVLPEALDLLGGGGGRLLGGTDLAVEEPQFRLHGSELGHGCRCAFTGRDEFVVLPDR